MTPEERAKIIIEGVMGSPQFEDSDRQFVIQKVVEHRLDVIEEMIPLVCGACAAGKVPVRITGVVHVSPSWRHVSKENGVSWYCYATPLREILGERREGAALPPRDQG